MCKRQTLNVAKKKFKHALITPTGIIIRLENYKTVGHIFIEKHDPRCFSNIVFPRTEMSHINWFKHDCKIYFLMFDRLDLRSEIWPKLCLIISFLHHYENYTFRKRFKCTWFTNRYTFFFLIISTNVLNKCTNNFI